MTTHVDDELSEFDDLRDLMTRALDDVDVPVQRLTHRAAWEGRGLRRRRRVVTAAGGLVAAAAVAALAVPLAGGAGDTATDPGPAGTPTATQDGALRPRPGFWDMPSTVMAARLTTLLPKRVVLTSFKAVSTDHAPGEPDVRTGNLTGTLEAPRGPGGIDVILTQLPDRSVLDAAAPDDADGDGDSDTCPPEVSSPDVEVRTCAIRRSSSGRIVERELETRYLGVTVHESTIVTHGGVIHVAVANSTGEKWATPTSAPTAPLTMDQVARIATSPAWTDWTPSRG